VDIKLCILTALWGRPVLSKLFLERMGCLINTFGISVVAVVSGDSRLSDLCDINRVCHVNCENKPLGKKWNTGLAACKDKNFTHLMILGSDDLPSNDFIRYNISRLSDGYDYFGSRGLYMFGGRKNFRGFGELFYFRYGGYLVGPGRCFSRKFIEKCNWILWDNSRNSGLDGSAAKRVRKDKFIKKGSYDVAEQGLFLVDIKTTGNVSGIPSGAKKNPQDFVDFVNKNLPPQEAENLKKFLIKTRAL